MATIAVYNLKGGVGKTTVAVNLAWLAAARSKRRTLLWDLDAQAAATYLLGGDTPSAQDAAGLFTRDAKPKALIRATGRPRLDLLPADASLATLDRELHALGKRKLLAKMVDDLARSYDVVILDCPPGLGEVAEQVVRAADLVVVPVVPSELSRRTLASVEAFVNAKQSRAVPLLPVHSMVDRRRTLHRAALTAAPDWPVLPMASVVDAMADRRDAIGGFAPRSAAAQAFEDLWRTVSKAVASAG